MRIEDHFTGPLRELAEAAAVGDSQRIARLVESGAVDPNALSEEGMPLLLWPLDAGNLAGFEALLVNGADPNRRARNGEQLMHYVVERGQSDFIQAALRYGADPNTVNRDKEPLLHIARRTHNWTAVEVLLDAGADIDSFAGDLYGNTILSVTTGFGDFEHAHWLLERGADPGFALKAAPKPERVGAQPMLEDVFHRPVDDRAYPEAYGWQQKCQQLLRARGFEPPPVPKRYAGKSTA